MTAIEWTDETWNPVTGCSKVSPGCAHCYAETLSHRFGRTTLPWTPEHAAANVVLHPDRLEKPLTWRQPRMVFVNSMSDLFHELVPDAFIAEVFETMRRCSQHTFQVLTKRPERALAWFDGWSTAFGRFTDGPGWPLPNVWMGVSMENTRWVSRADLLREIPAAVRFISGEPLLGPLVEFMVCGCCADWPETDCPECGGARWWPSQESLSLLDIDWLIVGGESGIGHRPIDPRWVRDLRDYATMVDVAFFFKQWGGRTPKAGGRLLDGRTWDEYPAVPTGTRAAR